MLRLRGQYVCLLLAFILLTCRQIEDENLPRAWSAHTPGSSAYKRKHEPSASHHTTTIPPARTGKRKRSDTEEKSGVPESDPKFKEFLEVMQPKSKSKTWGNEDLVSFSQDTRAQVSQSSPANAESSDDEYEDIPVQKKKPNPPNPEAMDVDYIKHKDSPIDGMQLDNEELDDTAGAGVAAVSDAEWLRSKTSRLLDLTDDVESHLAPVSVTSNTKQDTKKASEINEEWGEAEEDIQAEKTKEEQPEQSNHAKSEMEQAIETISQSGRLFLRNLPYSSAEEDLRQNFAPYGDLEEVSHPSLCFLKAFFLLPTLNPLPPK